MANIPVSNASLGVKIGLWLDRHNDVVARMNSVMNKSHALAPNTVHVKLQAIFTGNAQFQNASTVEFTGVSQIRTSDTAGTVLRITRNGIRGFEAVAANTLLSQSGIKSLAYQNAASVAITGGVVAANAVTVTNTAAIALRSTALGGRVLTLGAHSLKLGANSTDFLTINTAGQVTVHRALFANSNLRVTGVVNVMAATDIRTTTVTALDIRNPSTASSVVNIQATGGGRTQVGVDSGGGLVKAVTGQFTIGANNATVITISPGGQTKIAKTLLINGDVTVNTTAATLRAATQANTVSDTRIATTQYVQGKVRPFNCRLTKSGSNLQLAREGGELIFINGVAYVLPSTPITLVPTSSGTQLQYIYCYISGGLPTLEYSTTVPVADSTYGHPIKTSDTTRALVGMAYAVSNAWVYDAGRALVASYYNRRHGLVGQAISTSGFSTSGATIAIGIVAEAVIWGDSFVEAIYVGNGSNTGAAESLTSGIQKNGSGTVSTTATTGSSTLQGGFAVQYGEKPTQGRITFGVTGNTPSTTSWTITGVINLAFEG